LHDKKVFTLEGGTKIVSFTRKVAVLRERDWKEKNWSICNNKFRCMSNHCWWYNAFTFGSKHVTRSQKRCQLLDIISQNQTIIFLLPFKTIVIMAR
jgi:hypothetical protein